MHITGRSVGFSCWREYWRSPRPHTAPWRIQIGWGEGSGEEYDRLYRRNVTIELRPWRSWFIWWQELLTIENGQPVYQERIHAFWQWPISIYRS